MSGLSEFEYFYDKLVNRILSKGELHLKPTRAKWEDGTTANTISILAQQLKLSNYQAALLTKKRTRYKGSLKELKWIWFDHSNKVQDLRDMDCKIWDKWEYKDGPWKGTIGPAYGYQLGKPCRKFPLKNMDWDLVDKRNMDKYESEDGEFVLLNQVDYLLQSLKKDPYSRRHLTTLINIDDLDEMFLEPCVWKTKWEYIDDKLHLIVGARSSDVAVGLPFNIFQYQVLQHVVCQVLDYQVGELIFNIDNAHIYDRHIDTIKEQMVGEPFLTPELKINPNLKNFYDFQIEDIIVEGYQFDKEYDYEVAE